MAETADTTTKEELERAGQQFEKGDRVGALKLFEGITRKPVSQEVRQQALYGVTAVHASFGDVEQAQMSIREGMEAGLDFEAALDSEKMIEWKSAPQVLSQLKKFARSLRQARETAKPGLGSRLEFANPKSIAADLSTKLPQPGSDRSLSDMLKTDVAGMDASLSGIIKRLLLLLALGLVLGTALFYLGLEFSGVSH